MRTFAKVLVAAGLPLAVAALVAVADITPAHGTEVAPSASATCTATPTATASATASPTKTATPTPTTTATKTAQPSPSVSVSTVAQQLPVTGSNAFLIVGVGLILLAVGLLLFLKPRPPKKITHQ